MVRSKIITKAKQNFGANPIIMSNARVLRKNMTSAEKILWNYIRKKQIHGMHFRRQHPYGIYILDFYCFEANLVIELDGMIHLKKHDYDMERTKYLESTGVKVIRYSNRDIEERLDWVLNNISSYIVKSTLPKPSTTGEGGSKHFPLGGK